MKSDMIDELRIYLDHRHLLDLAEQCGGRQIAVPRSSKSSFFPELDPKISAALVAIRGGESVYIPQMRRDRANAYAADGSSVDEIARRLQVSKRSVQRYLVGNR